MAPYRPPEPSQDTRDIMSVRDKTHEYPEAAGLEDTSRAATPKRRGTRKATPGDILAPPPMSVPDTRTKPIPAQGRSNDDAARKTAPKARVKPRVARDPPPPEVPERHDSEGLPRRELDFADEPDPPSSPNEVPDIGDLFESEEPDPRFDALASLVDDTQSINMKTDLSEPLVAALARAEVAAYVFKVPELSAFCHTIKTLRVSLGRKGRREIVEAMRGADQGGEDLGIIEKFRRWAG